MQQDQEWIELGAVNYQFTVEGVLFTVFGSKEPIPGEYDLSLYNSLFSESVQLAEKESDEPNLKGELREVYILQEPDIIILLGKGFNGAFYCEHGLISIHEQGKPIQIDIIDSLNDRIGDALQLPAYLEFQEKANSNSGCLGIFLLLIFISLILA